MRRSPSWFWKTISNFPPAPKAACFKRRKVIRDIRTWPATAWAATWRLPNEAETILERSLHHASDLPPRSFVAITETSPEVELGTPAAREESSLHVIVGQVVGEG